MLRHFAIKNVYVNIDPFMGTELDSLKCQEIIWEYFPNANISTPNTAAFTSAVKRLWSQTSADLVIHLEDDWVLNEEVKPRDLEPLFVGRVRQVSMMCAQKDSSLRRAYRKGYVTGRHAFHKQRCKREIRLLGKKIMKIRTPNTKNIFTTSPSCISGEFVRTSAYLMDEKFDPEKQFYKNVNLNLERYASQFENIIYVGATNENLISDIGREKRSNNGVKKLTEGGKSFWVFE